MLNFFLSFFLNKGHKQVFDDISAHDPASVQTLHAANYLGT